ncbi:MAG: 50S ribosomal protein L4 [Nitrospirota bacterium]|nr:50S ribosomal protein L4 [Nitrospirota bacterium]
MAEIDIKDKNNNSAGKMDLPDDIFGVKASTGVLHSAIVCYLANQRQGTHAVKSRGMVRGGGKKPWKQKHTGRARAGSSRSPLWRGGGTVFGPQPRDYSHALPRKAKKLALKAALSGKLADGEVIIIDEIAIESPRTRDMVAILKSLGLEGKSTLIVLPENNDVVLRSARNIPGVTVQRVSDLNPYEVAVHSRMLMTRQSVEKLVETDEK